MRFFLLPLIPAATTPSIRIAPGAEMGRAGRSEARSHARTPSPRLPLSSLPPLSTLSCVCPLPGRGQGSEAPLEARVWSGSFWGFGAVPKVSRPRALSKNWRCRSLLSPAARLPRQVLPSFCNGCVSGNGPALPFRYQSVPEPASGATLGIVALGPRTAVESLAVQCADPQNTTAETARRGPGISPRLTPACGL